jgi:hypothetical protein
MMIKGCVSDQNHVFHNEQRNNLEEKGLGQLCTLHCYWVYQNSCQCTLQQEVCADILYNIFHVLFNSAVI